MLHAHVQVVQQRVAELRAKYAQTLQTLAITFEGE